MIGNFVAAGTGAHRQVAKELEADSHRARVANDREARAGEKERVDEEHRAAAAQLSEQNPRLIARVEELSIMLRACIGQRTASVEDLRSPVFDAFAPGRWVTSRRRRDLRSWRTVRCSAGFADSGMCQRRRTLRPVPPSSGAAAEHAGKPALTCEDIRLKKAQ